jgi:hypothetical protein
MGTVLAVMHFRSSKREFESQEQMEQRDDGVTFPSFHFSPEWTEDQVKPPLSLLRKPALRRATDIGIGSSLLISKWKMRMKTEYLSQESISSFVGFESRTPVSFLIMHLHLDNLSFLRRNAFSQEANTIGDRRF